MAQRVFSIAAYSVRQRMASPRVVCLFVLLIAFIGNDLSVIGVLTDSAGLKTNPLIFPFFSSDPVKQLILYAGVVFLYSDAPFLNKNQPYVIIRSKRTPWVLGQILHILMFSAIYFLILMFASVLILLPNATFATNGWGKIVNTLAQTNAGAQINLQFGVSDKIVTFYSPFQAFSLCFLLNWGMTSFLGLLMFAANLKFNRMIGPVIGGIVLFFDLLVANALPFAFYYYSPMSLSRLSVLDPLGVSVVPNTTYPFIFYGVGITILSAFLIVCVKRTPIEITSER